MHRGVAVVVPGDEQLLVPVQDLAGERGVAVQGGEVERRVELGRRGAEGTGILRIHQLPQARLATFPSVAAMYSAGSMRLSLSIDWQPQIEQIIFLAAGSAFNLIRVAASARAAASAAAGSGAAQVGDGAAARRG